MTAAPGTDVPRQFGDLGGRDGRMFLFHQLGDVHPKVALVLLVV